MTAPFDIFKVEVDGSLRWRGVAHSLEEAKARVEVLAKSESAEKYVVRSLGTGDMQTIRPDTKPLY